MASSHLMRSQCIGLRQAQETNHFSMESRHFKGQTPDNIKVDELRLFITWKQRLWVYFIFFSTFISAFSPSASFNLSTASPLTCIPASTQHLPAACSKRLDAALSWLPLNLILEPRLGQTPSHLEGLLPWCSADCFLPPSPLTHLFTFWTVPFWL